MTIDITRPIDFITKPYGIVLVSVIVSFVVWTIPGDAFSKGFADPQPLFSVGGLFVLAWYGSILLLSWLFFSLGKRFDIGHRYLDKYANVSDTAAYLLITLLAAIGTYYVTHFYVKLIGWHGIIDSIHDHQGNIFKKMLEEQNKTRGAASFRYCAMLSSGLTIFRILTRKKLLTVELPIDLLNFALLLLTSFYTGRLAIFAAIIFGICLYAFNHKPITIGLFTSLAVAGVVFGFLTFVTSARTYNTYEARGYTSASGATTAEVSRYLSAPFQESLAIGNNYTAALHGADHTELGGIEAHMTTNSALDELTSLYGWGAWPIIWITVSFVSLVMGILTHHRRNLLVLLYVVLLYCLSEIWRIFMFDKGVVLMMFLAVVFLVMMMSTFNIIAGRGVDLPEEEEEEEEEEEDFSYEIEVPAGFRDSTESGTAGRL